MASNFWIGASVSVTANSKLVTVLSSSDDITKIKEGAAFVASNYSIPFEVNRTYNDGSNDIIELKENWTGATSSSVSATVVVGPGAIASTREAIVNLISAYEAFEALVTPTVTANGLAQRTATGQLKTANAVNNDEAVAKGQFNSLTQSYLNTFGLGRQIQQPNWPNSNIDNCNGVASGVYRTNGSITAPDRTAIVYFSRRNAGQLQQILISGFDSGNTNTFQWRNSNGGSDSAPVWGEWKTVYHSGNSVNPQEFGLGGQGANFDSDNANNGIDSGIYRATSSTANIPISTTSTIIVTRSYNVITQLFCNGSTYHFRRSVNSGSSWDSWREIYHSGNSANPLDYGAAVKNKTLAAGHNLDTLIDNGTYTGFGQGSGSASTGDNPFTGNGAFTITVSRETFGSDNYTMQTATWYSNNTGILQKQRVKSTNVSGWTDWYDACNTSNTVIGKTVSKSVGRLLRAKFFASTPTSGSLFIDLNGTDTPSGFVINGALRIISGTGADMVTGLTQSDFALNGLTGPNRLRLFTNSVTGLTAGEEYYVCADSGTTAEIIATY